MDEDPIEEHRRRTLALADELDAKAAEHEREAASLRSRARLLRAQAGELDDEASDREHLAERRSGSYSEHVSAEGQPDVNVSRGKFGAKNLKHPFVRELHRRGMSLNAWAKANKVAYATARSWVDSGPASRRIAMSKAKEIERQMGLPATEATWPNGIHRYDE